MFRIPEPLDDAPSSGPLPRIAASSVWLIAPPGYRSLPQAKHEYLWRPRVFFAKTQSRFQIFVPQFEHGSRRQKRQFQSHENKELDTFWKISLSPRERRILKGSDQVPLGPDYLEPSF